MSNRIPTPPGTRVIVLNAGEFHFGGGNTRLSTLLGSCVSMTLWHPRKRIGGMCHYMLTTRVRPPGAPLDGRYASEAFELFMEQIAESGTRLREYQVKLFGGAHMFSNSASGMTDVGKSNVDYGLELLAKHNIATMSRHVGGAGRRKIHFDIWSGDVWLSFPEGEGADSSTLASLIRKKNP